MAVSGVKNVEIPRVANLSPERFHRLEKETMEKLMKMSFLETHKGPVKDSSPWPGNSSQRRDQLSSLMLLRAGPVDSGLLRYCLGTETSMFLKWYKIK